jgi:hypothetical protein
LNFLCPNTANVAVNIGSTLTLGGTNTVAGLTLAGGALAGSNLTVSGTVTATATGRLPASLLSMPRAVAVAGWGWEAAARIGPANDTP